MSKKSLGMASNWQWKIGGLPKKAYPLHAFWFSGKLEKQNKAPQYTCPVELKYSGVAVLASLSLLLPVQVETT